jgi:hypothetical protein
MFDHHGIGLGPSIAAIIAVVLIVLGRRWMRR